MRSCIWFCSKFHGLFKYLMHFERSSCFWWTFSCGTKGAKTSFLPNSLQRADTRRHRSRNRSVYHHSFGEGNVSECIPPSCSQIFHFGVPCFESKGCRIGLPGICDPHLMTIIKQHPSKTTYLVSQNIDGDCCQTIPPFSTNGRTKSSTSWCRAYWMSTTLILVERCASHLCGEKIATKQSVA